MVESANWDWDSGDKVIDISDWQNHFNWVEEPYVSPDGEKVAAIVNIDEGEFSVCVNGEAWPDIYEKAWHLRFTPFGRAAVLVADMGEWTVAVDGKAWENRYGYLWDLQFSSENDHISVSAQQDMQYGIAVDDHLWPQLYANLNNGCISTSGKATAAAVQVEDFNEAEVHKFQQGAFTAALNGNAWESRFVNAWNMAISPDEKHLAAEIRINLYEYTIAVDGKPWDTTFGGIWEPLFNPKSGSVVAPARIQGQWALVENGQVLWERRFGQLWNLAFSPGGEKLGAIVSPAFGRWTVAIDGTPWAATFSDMVTELTFSPDGSRSAVTVKEGDNWSVAVDGSRWAKDFAMAWRPVFSPDSSMVAAKVEKDGKYTIALDGKLWNRSCDNLWDPVFSPDASKLLVRSVENGQYHRRIIPITDIAG
jgi:hypothetical protein